MALESRPPPAQDRERLAIRTGTVLSIGPDGKTAVFPTNDAGRLDVWSLEKGGQHLAAWKPYGKESLFNSQIVWTAALADETVLSLNYEGRLMRWQLPECKAIYQRELGRLSTTKSWPNLGIFLAPGLSVNHQHLAIWSGKTLLILDAVSGKTLGSLGGTEDPGWLEPTFHPDGTKLACTIAENFTQVLVVYDLKTGAEVSRMPLPSNVWLRPGSSASRQGGLTWVGEPYAVVGSTLLVNLAEGRPVWKFHVPEEKPIRFPLLTVAGPDFWAVTKTEKGRTLSSYALPHADALRFAKEAPSVFAAGPGSTISVRSKVKGPPEVQAAIDSAVLAKLQELKMKVAEKQRVTLVIETEVRKTGDQLLVETLRRGKQKKEEQEKIDVHAIVLRASFLVDDKVAWSYSRDHLPYEESWDDVPGKTTAEELLDIQWQRTKDLVPGFFERLPGYIMDPKADAEFPSGSYPSPTAAARDAE